MQRLQLKFSLVFFLGAAACAMTVGQAQGSINVIVKTSHGVVAGTDTRMRVNLQKSMPFDVKQDDFGKIAQVGSHAIVVFAAMAYFKPILDELNVNVKIQATH